MKGTIYVRKEQLISEDEKALKGKIYNNVVEPIMKLKVL